MQSINLIPELERVPLRAAHGRYSWTDVAQRSMQMRNDLFAIEVAAGVEVACSGLFDARNVPDDLFEAFRLGFPVVSVNVSLHDRYLDMVERGPENITGFISNLKGKLAELQMPDRLQEEFPGYSFSIAASQNQPTWDIVGTAPDGGSQVLIQAKVGNAGYAGDVLARMHEDPDVAFAVSNEIRSAILDQHPELADQFLNLDLSNDEFTSGVEDGVSLLAENFGIDVPDALGDLLPYVTEVVLGIRILCDVVRTERDFRTLSLDDRGRMHAMKALVLFQRFGISSVCTAAGGAAGTAILPGLVTAGGAVGGALVAAYLNKKLRPHTLELAMWLLRVTESDLFYLRNKLRIDQIGASLAQTANGVCGA
ncbi:MAG: hypothetical protein WD042_04725 [Phycisphaeraceae bacterium]